MGKIKILNISALLAILIVGCWRDATKRLKVRETNFCFLPDRDNSKIAQSNGVYSFYHKPPNKLESFERIRTSDYSEISLFFPQGNYINFLVPTHLMAYWVVTTLIKIQSKLNTFHLQSLCHGTGRKYGLN